MTTWWEQLPVLWNNSIEKFAVEIEETMKCEMYQMEKAEHLQEFIVAKYWLNF